LELVYAKNVDFQYQDTPYLLFALLIEAGAKMTQMENRIVLARFKDGYGPVGAYFLHLKTYTQNAYGDIRFSICVIFAPASINKA
jgi:hypothetical protein